MTRILIAFLAALSVAAHAYDGPVEKKTFTLPSLTTVSGKTLKDVKVGYETYGKRNAAGDNAVFVPHFFSGTSHAAGKYAPADAAAGYWDAIIGAGRAIDNISFDVKDLEALCKKLIENGVKLDSPPHAVPDLNASIAFLTDPWGMRIELIEKTGK